MDIAELALGSVRNSGASGERQTMTVRQSTATSREPSGAVRVLRITPQAIFFHWRYCKPSQSRRLVTGSNAVDRSGRMVFDCLSAPPSICATSLHSSLA